MLFRDALYKSFDYSAYVARWRPVAVILNDLDGHLMVTVIAFDVSEAAPLSLNSGEYTPLRTTSNRLKLANAFDAFQH